MNRRLRHLAALLASALGAAGCLDLFSPLPDEAVLLTQVPSEYRGWWAIVEQCSREGAQFDDVEWWVLPGRRSFSVDDDAIGKYYDIGHRIVLAEEYIHDGFLVRHEMLHAILAGRGVSGHPRAYFETLCGGLVSCGGDCLSEVGSPSPTIHDIPLLDVSDGEITVQAVPDMMSGPPPHGSCTTIVVGVRNTSPDPAVIDLTNAFEFGWSVDGVGGGSGGGPSPVNDFGLLQPNAIRWQAYECPETIRHLPTGSYWLRGRWQWERSEPVRFTVSP